MMSSIQEKDSSPRLQFIHAFTLIELLVVITIISILAAMLMPVLKNARESTRRGSCANNLKQIVLAIIMYTDDHDGFLPLAFEPWDDPENNPNVEWWCQLISPYVDDARLYLCLSDRAPWDSSAGPWITTPEIPKGSYGYNIVNGGGYATLWLGEAKGRPRHINDIVYPSEALMVVDSISKPEANWWGTGDIDFRHGGGANIAYCDGHVKWQKIGDIPYDIDGRIGGTASRFWAGTDN